MNIDECNVIRSEIIKVIEETFEKHHGYFTDKGSSLFETLKEIDAVGASKPIDQSSETIAAHVFHMKYYIRVLIEYITGKRTGKTDWNESWVIKTVNETEWENMKMEIVAEYKNLLEYVETVDDFRNEDTISGLLAIIAHCAYHLGSIRQLQNII